MSLADDAHALADELMQFRRDLHRHPEVGLQLPRTQQRVLDALEPLGLEITTGRGLSSVTAVLRGGVSDGPAVLLRADMDALPLTEASGVEYASEVDDAMHACGHDLHTAMLVGAATVLARRRDELPGDVVFMFQPGEEGWDGAGLMVDEGVLDAAGRRVNAAYGMHVMSAKVPHGRFTTRPGPFMAAADGLYVTINGAGAHASAPHAAKDPITTAAALIGELQTFVTRRFDVFDPVVLTVGLFRAGTIRNIIPDTAHFEATVRTFSPQARDRLRTEVVTLCERFAEAHGQTATVEYREEFDLTSNDTDEAAFAAEVATDVFGDTRYVETANPLTGSEDFARVLDRVPGCYLFLGAGLDDDTAEYNHSPRAVFRDDVLTDGALLHCELATRALTRLAGGRPATAE